MAAIDPKLLRTSPAKALMQVVASEALSAPIAASVPPTATAPMPTGAEARALSRANMVAEAKRAGLLPRDGTERDKAPTEAEQVAVSQNMKRIAALGSRTASLENMRAEVRRAGMVPK